MKHISIMPLTGGMLLGAIDAFKCDPECIISYNGLGLGNEKVVLDYFKKINKQIPYHSFSFGVKDVVAYGPDWGLQNEQYVGIENSEIEKYFKDIDVVHYVPVCSGLSLASGSKIGSDAKQNNNQLHLTKYVFSKIRPKVAIYENAPGLYNNLGTGLRQILADLALEAGYSTTFVFTNTNLHDNVQYRPRSFVIFWRNDFNTMAPPEIGFERITRNNIVEYMNEIPKWANHNDPVKDNTGSFDINESPFLRWIIDKWGTNWQEEFTKRRQPGDTSLGVFAIYNNLIDEVTPFILDNPKRCPPSPETWVRWCAKLQGGGGFWDYSPCYIGNEKLSTCYYKNVTRVMHPVENRGFTKREWMWSMKFPHDLDWPEDVDDFVHRCGQNVVVRTAEFWFKEIGKVVDNWSDLRKKIPAGRPGNIYYHNNVKPETCHYEGQTSNMNKQGFKF